MNGTTIATLLALFLAEGERRNEINEEADREVTIKDEYDFIVVGAGTSGCVVAASTLVLEAGQSGRNDLKVDVPIFAQQLVKTSREWNITTVPQKHRMSINGPRTMPYEQGRVGGGSSALNYHVYVRGHEYDYKLWEDQGATGWSLKDLRKYFDKIENGVEPGMSQTVYKDGKLKLGKTMDMPLTGIIHRAANSIGIPSVDYLDDGGLKLGVSNITRTVANGERQYALNSYLHPAWETRKQSLDIAYGAMAHKILFHDVNGETKAYAVRFEHKGEMREVRARKEIILSAGVINSPQLLMLSGIGPKEHLEDISINVVADVPGVGSNAEGHPAMSLRYFGTRYPKNAFLFYDDALKTLNEYSTKRTGPMSAAVAMSTHINVRSHVEDAFSSETYPFSDINIHVSAMGEKVESKKFSKEIYGTDYNEAINERNGTLFHFQMMLILPHTRSRGTVRLQSNDPKDHPLFDPNDFDRTEDYNMMVESIKLAEKLEMTSEFKKYGIKRVMIPDHCRMNRQNASRSKCWYDPMKWMGRLLKLTCGIKENRIHHREHKLRSNDFYKCYIGQISFSYHETSTCKMGKREDKMAVLDHRLRLHAVSNLRVADASVMPHTTSANPQATCYVIGEKAADMIKEDWNLSVEEYKFSLP